MNARQKLNAVHLYGVLLLAGIIAAVAGSWPLFWFLAIVLTVSAVHAGDIRLSSRRRK